MEETRTSLAFGIAYGILVVIWMLVFMLLVAAEHTTLGGLSFLVGGFFLMWLHSISD